MVMYSSIIDIIDSRNVTNLVNQLMLICFFLTVYSYNVSKNVVYNLN
jgi:hypothetical protein